MHGDWLKNFFWGTSTSAHQVEGHNENDWTEWERKNAIRLAKNAERNFRHSPEWAHIADEARDPQNYISGAAADHWHRYEEDFDLAKCIGLNSYRLSIEWSRVEPSPGFFDEAAISHYRKIISALKEREIEPFITIWHFTLPVWLAEQGGILSEFFSEHFCRYTKKLISVFGEEVKFWITINEPEIYAWNGYLRGIWPPEKRGLINFYRAIEQLVKTHQLAYACIKSVKPELQVGASLNLSYFEAAPGIINSILKKITDRIWNHHFLGHIAQTFDFIGLNYYFHNRINYGFNKNKNEHISDLGWELHPEGIKDILLSLKKYEKPIYITENGLADEHDRSRAWFIEHTLKAVKEAIALGADVRGYFHWSLLDNFEWDKGFWPRFGLIEVDYKTLKRKMRLSADVYGSIIKNKLKLW